MNYRLRKHPQGSMKVAMITVLFASLVLPGLFAAPQVPTVAVSILPQTEFVSTIAGEAVKVISLVGPGASPHNYEPSPRQMADLSRASLWFTIGVEFETALLPKIKALYPDLEIVNSAEGVRYRRLESDDEHGEAEGGSDGDAHEDGEEAHGHEEGGLDPHVWLGFDAVKIQLSSILKALSALVPERKALFEGNYHSYIAQIDRVYAELERDLAPLKGSSVLVYHPSFGYFLDSFGIRQEAVELGGKEPTQKTLAALINRAKLEGVRTVFVQKQFSSAAARTIASAIGGIVAEIDPLAPAWLDNTRVMGNALKNAFRP
ncbi:MAG: zinc ABC transporter substrate-binding protein [Spirochaetia bacterium]|nr:zinc ABC transporter substrate-binding protein [Spirochaetia bacterium]